MTNSRSHRSLRTRFLLYGLGVCFVVGTIYIYDVTQDGSGQLVRCEAGQSTLREQLRTVIDHKEDLMHSLESIKLKHADAIADLETRQEEQNKITKDYDVMKNQFDDLSIECNKLKNIAKTDHELLENCKNQNMEVVFQNHDFEMKLKAKSATISSLLEQLKTVTMMNEDLKLKLLLNSGTKNSEQPPFYYPVSTNDINISKQIQSSEDVYQMVIQKPDNAFESLDNVKNINDKAPNVTQKTLPSQPKEIQNLTSKNDNTLNEEIPQGVAPELFVDDHPNDGSKQVEAVEKDAANKEDDFDNNLLKRKLSDPSNRYELKMDNDGVKSINNNADSFLPKDDPNKQDIIAANLINIPLNGGKNLIKKEDSENDINIGQNNPEPEAQIENNMEDDDDVDDFGYPRVEAAEEALVNN